MEKCKSSDPISCTSTALVPRSETLTLKSLDVISKISGMLQTSKNKNGFVPILEKILALVDGEESENRKLKYGLVEKVMSNILQADRDELISAKEYFERTLYQKNFKYLLIKEVDLQRLPRTVAAKNRINVCHVGELRQPNGSWKLVGIKRAMLAENDKFIEHEAKIMCQLNHKNIIKFYGRCETEPEIVLELMDLGCLVSVMEEVKFTTRNLLQLLGDVASGMEYVKEKQYIHRNLICFNIFLNKRKQCKIGNFGFAVYVGDSNGVYIDEDCSVIFEPDGKYFTGPSCSIALVNLPPEVITTKAFSAATDVWCMGLLCWDIFYIAEHSSPNLLKPGIHRGLFSLHDVQLPRSKNCPDVLYRYITKDLLNKDPKKRPDFTAIRTKIREILSKMTDQDKY